MGARGRGGEKRTREEEEKAGKRREEEGREGNQVSCKLFECCWNAFEMLCSGTVSYEPL